MLYLQSNNKIMKAQIGLPVQFFDSFVDMKTKPREVFAAIIVDLRDNPHAETDLIVFNKTNISTSYLIQNVRHKDFQRNNHPYWDYLEEE